MINSFPSSANHNELDSSTEYLVTISHSSVFLGHRAQRWRFYGFFAQLTSPFRRKSNMHDCALPIDSYFGICGFFVRILSPILNNCVRDWRVFGLPSDGIQPSSERIEQILSFINSRTCVAQLNPYSVVAGVNKYNKTEKNSTSACCRESIFIEKWRININFVRTDVGETASKQMRFSPLIRLLMSILIAKFNFI